MNASKIPLPEYALPVPDSARQALARAWLWLGLLSLIGSGVFAVLLWGHRFYGWRGRVAVRWTVSGFVLLLLAYLGSKFVLEVLLQR